MTATAGTRSGHRGRRGTRLALYACLAALAVSGPAADVSFHCPYDGTVDAAHAAGPRFAVCKNTAFVDGKTGRALSIDEDADRTCYVGTGNLDKARGSIELWLRPQWPEDDAAWRGIVWEEGPRGLGTNAIWLWKYGRSLRFDVRDLAGTYITCSLAKWSRNEWRHIVATWDCGLGIRLFVDGELTGSKDTTWTPKARDRFFVGAGASPNVAFGVISHCKSRTGSSE